MIIKQVTIHDETQINKQAGDKEQEDLEMGPWNIPKYNLKRKQNSQKIVQ